MIDLKDKRDGLPTNENVVVTSTDLAEQNENLMQEAEVGVPRDVSPVPGSEQHIAESEQGAPEQRIGDHSGPVTKSRSDVTIETSATLDVNSPASPHLFEDSSKAQRQSQTTNNTADRSEEAVNETLALFSEFEINDLRSRWSVVQASFVDAPRRSVEQADQLVAAVMQRISDGFATERSTLERQWDRGDSISTEDLRVALQRYRVFFGRLLNAA